MSVIKIDDESFNFEDLTLANPSALQGGAYFSKIVKNGDPVYVQLPKCKTKNGIKKTEKKLYCDLLFTNENNSAIEWIERVEKRIQDLLFQKRDAWFQTDLDQEDIEGFFVASVKTYKATNYLVRTEIATSKLLDNKPLLQIYSENEEEKQITDITETVSIIPIIEITGLKLTPNKFQIDYTLKQLMILEEKNFSQSA